jgi:hypothetical protein
MAGNLLLLCAALVPGQSKENIRSNKQKPQLHMLNFFLILTNGIVSDCKRLQAQMRAVKTDLKILVWLASKYHINLNLLSNVAIPCHLP